MIMEATSYDTIKAYVEDNPILATLCLLLKVLHMDLKIMEFRVKSLRFWTGSRWNMDQFNFLYLFNVLLEFEGRGEIWETSFL